ncbi:DNA ligase/mRNA capping enzyme [Cryphonectria parasitica EP155]|uniref:DNA ligase/mRNA capping enzyme n=1 Tax=Cryphonectria parasitica (strain ATCC 38755 / EP155) TaxID=660469 RepID=A0A9P4Y596_CRYP1|nr:DNA ligase/mRNA capping enzyme [Cryphonectria parasitica EP155]KAF3767182.1 DNA ligase/mRNA capping enzyme [Cryphonectria parasitica EP155]
MKWEEQKFEPKQLPHLKLGTVPTRLFKKTDVTRVEDCPNLFTKAKYHKYLYQESVKMDGTSMTIYFVNSNLPLFANLNPLPEKVGPNTVHPNGRFGVCSKNMDINELSDCQFGYWKIALRYDLPKKLAAKGRSVAIHGEFCGHNINQNREKIRGGQVDFFVFSIYDVTTQKYMNPKIVVGIAQQLGLKHVPVLGYVKIREIADSHHELKKRAMQRKGEGLVYKCLHDGRSFKVISSTYLLEHGL